MSAAKEKRRTWQQFQSLCLVAGLLSHAALLQSESSSAFGHASSSLLVEAFGSNSRNNRRLFQHRHRKQQQQPPPNNEFRLVSIDKEQELSGQESSSQIVNQKPKSDQYSNRVVSLSNSSLLDTRKNGQSHHVVEQLDKSPDLPQGIESNRYFNESTIATLPAYAVYTNDTVGRAVDTTETKTNGKTKAHQRIWRRRNARSAEEGIRREKLPQLSSLLEKAQSLDSQSPRYAARTIAGLVSALAEEADDLDVQVVARPNTPFWDKEVDQVKIKFSRLGFKPLKMGGLNKVMEQYNEHYPNSAETDFSKQLRDLSCADEAFKQIDVDNSGFLDREEIGEALLLASGVSTNANDGLFIQELAQDLLELYDVNGDGVISRSEYQLMVEDMAELVKKQQQQEEKAQDGADSELNEGEGGGFWDGTVGAVGRFFGNVFGGGRNDNEQPALDGQQAPAMTVEESLANGDAPAYVLNSTESANMIESGSITLSDLKLDLRRLVFGAVPLVKHITPGGPLILEPFTVTINGSFNRDDIMQSSLLEAGLSRLIAMVLRRRVRSLRDMTDLAVLFGRDYKLTSKNAPVTEVMELSNVEFDAQNRLIMTGRAKVRTRPGAPTIEQAFKVRAKLGTRKGGRFIRLVEPELAFVLECPKGLEKSIGVVFEKMGMKAPSRPEPFYSFFPIYSPFKPDDNDGFDMGEDNKIQNICIHDGALRFELSTVLRPGRFLGSHYIAFTLPFRTFIITLDRVKEGFKAARKAKKEKRLLERTQKQKLKRLEEERMSKIVDSETLRKKPQRRRAPRKSFFSRFVEGYMQAEREGPDRARFASSIRDFFGRQTGNSSDSTPRR